MAVTTINIPSQVLTYADLASFPVTGANNTIYIAEDTNTAYYWDGSTYTVLGTAGGNQDLQSVTDQGNTTTNVISVGDLTGLYSEISGSSVGTASVVNGTYAYMSQDGTVGMNNGAVESVLKNTNLTAGNNVVLEFPDKTSGSYTIATLDDIPPAQVQSDWNQSDNTDPSYILNKPTITSATNYGLFAQTANSPTITATTNELTLIDGGVGSLSVPANGFNVGDSFRVDMGGLISAQNNNTITIRLKTGSVILGNSGALTLPAITNQVWYLSVNFTVRAIGAAGVASIVAIAQFHILKAASGTQQGFAWNTVNNTTFNTTIQNTLDITAQFSSNSANNSIYSDIFTLNKIY